MAWRELRKRYRWFLASVFIHFASIIAALSWASEEPVAVWAVMVLGVPIVLWLGVRVNRFRCPHCGGYFSKLTSSPFIVPRGCVRCSQPRGS